MHMPRPPVKTQLGIDELRTRAHGLNQRHRTVLFLVDGQRPLSEVLALGLQAGARTTHFADLVHLGMVDVVLEPDSSAVDLQAPARAPKFTTEDSSRMPLKPLDSRGDAAYAQRRALARSELDDLHQDVRELLIDTLRVGAPLFAALTLVRVRRAQTARELINLAWEIERHLVASKKSRPEMQTLYRARELLGMGNTQVSTDEPTGLAPELALRP
ncbi:MAG: hypothetical protein WCJ87_00270 [Burkholderiales bacterium]